MFKRICAIVLSAVMILGCVQPVIAEENVAQNIDGISYIDTDENYIDEEKENLEEDDIESIKPLNPEYHYSDNYKYYIRGDRETVSIVEYMGSKEGKLVIPDIIDGYSVTRIEDEAFKDCSGFTGELVIPNSVTFIGDYAFSNCSGFTGDLVIPNNVTGIGEHAFSNCNGFTGNLVIPNSVISIGNKAFSNCKGFSGDLTIPDSVRFLGTFVFEGCSGFAGKLTISKSINTLKSGVFKGCNGLTGTLEIPDNITLIESSAFEGCTGFFGKLKLPSNLTEIGSGAFERCSNLTGNLIIPNNVTSIGINAFMDCSGFTGDLVIPNSVTFIGHYAFSNCSGLNGTLKLSNSLTSIGISAFSECSKLTGDLIIPDSVTSIGGSAFYNCSGFNGVLELSRRVTEIEARTFCFCEGLTGKLILPNGVTKIGTRAFERCKNLTGKLLLPDSVTVIDDYAFDACKGLTGYLNIPDGVTSIGRQGFYGCTGFSSLRISGSVESIGFASFGSCYGLSRIVNESNVVIDLTQVNQLPPYWKNELTNALITEIGKGVAIRSDYDGKKDEGDEYVATVEFEMKNKDYEKDKENEIEYEIVGEETVCLKDEWFGKSPYTYNHELAQTAACLSTVMYNEGTSYIISAFKDLGFNVHGAGKTRDSAVKAGIFYPDETNKEDDDSKTGLYSPVWIVDKKICVGEEYYNLLLVSIRGTSGTEWIDNFDPGKGETHIGFERAANAAIDAIENYIIENEINSKRLKILVTGHSRGAAVANLIGKKLDDGEVKSLYGLDRNNFYIYTYACPNVTTNLNRYNDRYNNIYNIINPEDFVPKVMPVKWGYGRYGVTYSLPSSSLYWPRLSDGDSIYSSSYSEFLEEVKELREEYDYREEYEPYLFGMEAVTNYVSYITKKITSVNKYYSYDCSDWPTFNSFSHSDKSGVDYCKNSLFTLYTKTLGYFQGGKQWEAFGNLLNALLETPGWGDIGQNTLYYFVGHAVSYNDSDWLRKDFNKAHEPTTYMAMLKLVSPSYLQLPKIYREVLVSCPVDILVKDSSGKKLGEVKNNEVIGSNDKIFLEVKNESKTVFLPGDDDYVIEVVGNAEGTMDYTVIEYDPDLGEIQRISYTDLPVTEHQVYTEVFEQNKATDKLELYSPKNEVVTPDGVYKGESLGNLSINISVTGKGYADGYESLSPGDYVTLTATPIDEYNEFIGWYDKNGKSVSTESKYGISVTESLELEARFTDNESPENPPKSFFTVTFDTGVKTVAINVRRGNLIIKPVDPVKEGYIFAGWYKEKECINQWDFSKDIVTEDIILYAKWTTKEDGDDSDFPEVPVDDEDIPEKGYVIRLVGDDGKEIKEGIYSTEYTGYKVVPKVHIYHDRKRLVEGIDYKLVYGNNINAAKATDTKAPYVRITGMGEYSNNKTIPFEIKKVSLKDCVYDETVKIKKGSNFKPIIIFDGYELNNKNYILNKTDKWNQSGKLTVTGNNNFADSIEINVEVMDDAPKSAKVLFASDKLYYNGKSQIPVITVKDSKDSSKKLELGKDYKVSVSKDTTSAGQHSILVRGIGDYYGKIVKKYTINPKKLTTDDIFYKVTPSVSYNAIGANTKLESIEVKLNGTKTPLVLNKDYKITCRNNKKAGTANYQITFAGNYKGTAAINGTYTIEKAKASDFNVIPLNKNGYKKPGVYVQSPLVEYDNRVVGKSDYTVKYYIDSEYTVEMGNKSPLVMDTDKDYATVYVLITGKNNFDSSSIKTEYKVYKTPSSSAIDLSKATVTINPKTCKFNGDALTPAVIVTYKEGNVTKTLDSSKYTVKYFNNTCKGTATVVVTGNGTDAIGSKTNTFRIIAGSILDLFVN